MPHTLKLLLAATLALATHLPAQTDATPTPTDGGGESVLESIHIPNLPNAPFTLTLHTEWIRSLNNGGTFTVANNRPILRDRQGRIYMERWLLSPKGSGIPSQMSAIQIDDPGANRLYTCMVRTKTCTVTDAVNNTTVYHPEYLHSGPLTDGKGTFQHEDLGRQSFAGMPVHGYRDTTTVNPGVFGNDLRMSTTREFLYSPDLGFNLSSILDSPQSGRQVFTVTDLNTTEPDPSHFQPPAGYAVVDRRKPAQVSP